MGFLSYHLVESRVSYITDVSSMEMDVTLNTGPYIISLSISLKENLKLMLRDNLSEIQGSNHVTA